MKKSWEKFAPAAIVLLTLIVYARAIDMPYVWDDVSLIKENKTLDDASNIPRYFMEDLGHFNRDVREMGFYRPLQSLTFHLEVALFGRNAPVQHAVNILLHALAALAVFFLAKTMIRSVPWALFAGLLFAAHPLTTEQVCFIADRGGVMAGAFSLMTLALIARAFPESGETRRGPLIGAAAFFVLALFSKDEALTMAAPAAAWVYLARPKRRKDARAYAAAVLPVALLTIAYVVWRWGVLDISHVHRAVAVKGGLTTRLLAIPRLCMIALRLTLAPVGLVAMRSPDYRAWTAAPSVIASAAAWIVLFVFAWRARGKAPAATFGAFFFAATMAPSSGVVPLIRPIAEHYYYLPAAGVCMTLAGVGALGWETAGSPRLRQALAAAAGALLLAFSIGTIVRCGVWQSNDRLWDDNLAKQPENHAALTNRGISAAEAGDTEEAYELFNRAVSANPNYLKARINRARAALLLGITDGVMEDVRTVLGAEPCNERILMQLGRLIAIGGEPAARTFAEQWTRAHSCAAVFEAGAGMAYEEKGKSEEARDAFQRFLDALPAHPQAQAVKAELTKLGGKP